MTTQFFDTKFQVYSIFISNNSNKLQIELNASYEIPKVFCYLEKRKNRKHFRNEKKEKNQPY